MKNLIKKSTFAVSIVLGSSAAFAQEPPAEPVPERTRIINTTNETTARLSKDISVEKNLKLEGSVEINGKIVVEANTMAVVDDKQLNYDNKLNTDTVGDPEFNATVGTVSGNAGNIGVNVTSGAFNQQDNAAAIAASDQSFLHGSTDAEIFSHQRLWTSDEASDDSGLTLNGPQFTASITTIDGNEGNAGINISSGVSNQQKNNVAISTGVSKLAEASVAVLQEVTGMTATLNTVEADGLGGAPIGINFTASVGDVTNNIGNVGVNVASGVFNQQANNLSITAVQ